MRRSVGGPYPKDWPAIAKSIKDACGWRCIRCDAAHDPPRHVLTVHHLDMQPSHSGPEWWFNLAPLCTRCHLTIQAKVDLARPWCFEHSEWAKPLMAGHYARLYLGLFLTREEVEGRLEELLSLEAHTVIGAEPIRLVS